VVAKGRAEFEINTSNVTAEAEDPEGAVHDKEVAEFLVPVTVVEPKRQVKDESESNPVPVTATFVVAEVDPMSGSIEANTESDHNQHKSEDAFTTSYQNDVTLTSDLEGG
jgi:hypothetical protein